MRPRTIVVIVLAIVIVVIVIVAQGWFQQQPATPESAPTAQSPETPVAQAAPTDTTEAPPDTPTDIPTDTPTETPEGEPAAVASSSDQQPESPLQSESPLQPKSPLSQVPAFLAPGAAWPPGRLIFHSNAGLEGGTGNYQIYSVVDGIGPVSLTPDLGRSIEPSLSPDGTQIAFAMYTGEGNDLAIYLMDADGSNPRPVMEDQPNINWRPTWSPDGQQIIFVSLRDGNFELYKVNVDGTGLVNLTNHIAHDHDADWSPDGSKIVFVSDRDYGERAIYTMDPDGGNVQEIPGPDCRCAHPRWSPDGSQIAYASSHDTTWDIFVMNPDGSNIRQVTTRPLDNYLAAWINDDQLIYSGEDGTPIGQDLYLINVDGTDEVRLTATTSTEENYPNWRP